MRVWLIFCVVGFSIVAREVPESLSRAELQREVTAHLTQKKFEAAQWGVEIISLDSGALIYETNAHKLLKPASNAKIFTGALSLEVLGPEARIRTSLLSASAPEANGVLAGDLIVYGRGDPSFAARFEDGSYSNLLGRLVKALESAGVKEIKGDLVGDDTFFSGPRMGSGWTWDDLQYYYGAEASALSVQENVIDLFIKPGIQIGEPCQVLLKPETDYLEFINRTRTSGTNVPAAIFVTRPVGERRVYLDGRLPARTGTYVDAVTVPEPARWFITLFKSALERSGIAVRGKLRTRSWPEEAKSDLSGLREIAFTDSPPVREIAAKMLKHSQNLYAQLLFLQVGAHASAAGLLTEDAGVKEMSAFVKRCGIDPGEVLLEEGSGLSRSCLVTPHALVTVLQHMSTQPAGEIFREALPAPGEGTLRNRFGDWREKPGRMDLRAKTGTIRYVNTLSGYLRNGPGKGYVFSILLNAYRGPTSGRDEVETVLRLLARLKE